MNEITAAIRKKAEEKYEIGDIAYKTIVLTERAAYTCGGEDAIGFMLKFMEWVQYNYEFINEGDYAGFYFRIMGGEINYTRIELLTEYMEETKL